MKYKLIDYFDVWGNEEDGWEVNNLCTRADDLFILDDTTDQELLTFLKQIGFLTTDDVDLIEVDWSSDGFCELFAKQDGYPLGRLEAIWTD